MINALNSMYISAKLKFSNFLEELKNGEAGVSNFVATVLLILIVVLLTAVFWEYISEWFEDIWERITGASDGIG